MCQKCLYINNLQKSSFLFSTIFNCTTTPEAYMYALIQQGGHLLGLVVRVCVSCVCLVCVVSCWGVCVLCVCLVCVVVCVSCVCCMRVVYVLGCEVFCQNIASQKIKRGEGWVDTYNQPQTVKHHKGQTCKGIQVYNTHQTTTKQHASNIRKHRQKFKKCLLLIGLYQFKKW